MDRLNFGNKTVPGEFNRVIDLILEGLSKITVYFDNTFVHGKTEDECLKDLLSCPERLLVQKGYINITCT